MPAFGGRDIFSPSDVTNRSNPEKGHLCTETRYDLGACPRKGHDKTVQKVTNVLYFSYLGKTPTKPICTKIYMDVVVLDVITMPSLSAL